jgi:predicted alpha/beta hydrolase
MGRETANIHLGAEEKRKAILKDLRGRTGNWLLGAAQAMADAMARDWRVWRERRRS